jgi:ABC-type branched-subunit amino acid transport system ATPase component
MLLDEPSLGLAPLIVAELYTLLAKLKETGITMVLVEQHARRALQVADQALVLNLGAVALEGQPEAIANDPRLVSAYMGGFQGHEI